MLVTDMIRSGAERHGDAIAVRHDADTLTFAEVDAVSGRLASILAADAPPATPIGLLTNNGLFSVPLDFACAKARLIRVPLNARLSLAEHVQCPSSEHLAQFGPCRNDRNGSISEISRMSFLRGKRTFVRYPYAQR
jgi:fatty-acyl-CoA synthase